jgi:hypothetical protein
VRVAVREQCAPIRYRLACCSRCAASSFWTSSGESFGRSMLNVIFFSAPVNLRS